MRVQDLPHHLKDAAPNTVLPYLLPYSDASEAEVIVHPVVSNEFWTCERHRSRNRRADDIHHPAANCPSLGWCQDIDQQSHRRAVTLSSVPGAWYG